MKIEDLKKELAYKWKPQGKNKAKTKMQCVAFMDSRDAQRLLDEVCGALYWQSLFYEAKGKLFCKVGIKFGEEWIWKSDSGALDDSEFISHETTSKGESSDAFKRACVQWGIGRFLYEKDIVWLDITEYEANKYKLTEFIKNRTPGYKTPQSGAKKNWLNYDDLVAIKEAGNFTEEQVAKVIKEDGFTLSKNAKEAVREYVNTGEIDKNLFFKK